MRRIAQLIGYELKWEQPNILKTEYNLYAGDELAAAHSNYPMAANSWRRPISGRPSLTSKPTQASR